MFLVDQLSLSCLATLALVLIYTRLLGVGAALLETYVTHCIGQGIRRLHLEVRGDNPARRFYTSHGFQEIGLRVNYYRGLAGKYRDAVTLSRILD